MTFSHLLEQRQTSCCRLFMFPTVDHLVLSCTQGHTFIFEPPLLALIPTPLQNAIHSFTYYTLTQLHHGRHTHQKIYLELKKVILYFRTASKVMWIWKLTTKEMTNVLRWWMCKLSRWNHYIMHIIKCHIGLQKHMQILC